MKPYEVYGVAAQALDNPFMITGRYSFQSNAADRMVADVISKVSPQATDRALEIGCGVGIILNPLAELVTEAIGIDHPNVIAKYQSRGVHSRIRLLGGEWPATRPEGKFDIIIAYSVLLCLTSEDDAWSFYRACLDLLNPGGRLLLGDMPNRDAKARFLASPQGRLFAQEWERVKHQSEADMEAYRRFFSNMEGQPGHYITDSFVFAVLADARKQGFESYLLPQPSDLPFGQTREDILIRKRG